MTRTLLLVLAVLAAACSQTSDEERALFETLAEADALDGAYQPTDAESRCIEREARDAGLDPDKVLSDAATLTELQRISYGCVDDLFGKPGYITQTANSFGFGAGMDTPPSDAEMGCLLRHVEDASDDPIAVMNGAEDLDLLTSGVEACFTAETQADLYDGAAAAPGDNENADLFAGACEDGVLEACDVLYFLATIDSEYAALANSCGGVAEPFENGYCSADVAIAGEYVDEAAPGTDALRAACGDGVFVSCDLLFHLSPPGSAIESFAFTCGDRISFGGLPSCFSRLG